MTNLNGSRITEFLPSGFASEPEIQAFSYALGKQIEKLCNYADDARTYAAINSMPDKMLDILAVEVRTPGYLETDNLSIKRALIMDTLTFYMTAGTPNAANRIVQNIFGEGRIWEWFEYGGDPYHFKVVTTNADISGAAYNRFINVLNMVKNVRSILDEVIIAVAGSWNYVFYISKSTWNNKAGLTWTEVAAGK